MEKLSESHRKHISKSIKGWWKTKSSGKGGEVTKSCPNCGSKFKSFISDNRKYCSRKCYRDFVRGHKQGTIKKCKVCGKEFYVRPNKKAQRRQFCSRECMSQYLKKHWHEIRGSYPKTRKYVIRQHGKCDVCGFSDMRILNIHHKDGDRTNWKPDNILVLCPNHHMLAHLNKNKLDLRGWHKMTENDRKNNLIHLKNQS